LRLNEQDATELLNKLNLNILDIRALLVSAEYFDQKIVQAVYYSTKSRLRQDNFTELNIITDKFAIFESETSYAELEKVLKIEFTNQPLRISILSTDKTEIHYTEIKKENKLSKVFFEDGNIRLIINI